MEEKIPVRKIDAKTYMETVRKLLKEGKEVPLVVTGNSMAPFLIHGRDQILVSRITRPLKKGDMAFFQRTTGQYVMHRIKFIKKDKKTGNDQFFFVGDAQKFVEGPVEKDRIFGVITAVQRKGKRLNEHNFLWKFYKHIWIYVVPFRGYLLKIYSILFSNNCL